MKQQGWIGNSKTVLTGSAAFLLSLFLTGFGFSQNGIKLPKPVKTENFAALKGQSPFLRELNLSETYAIRAVATIGDTVVATLYNRNTKKTHMVFPEEENEQGMKLVEVSDEENPLKVTAKVAFAGEVFDVKYDAAQTRVAPRTTAKSSGSSGKSGSDKNRGPSQKDMETYKSLSEEQRNKFRDYIRYTSQKYPNMSREERGNLIRGAMNKIAEGREVTMEPVPNNQSGGGGDRR